MNHPYAAYEGTPMWKIVSAALKRLEENADLQIQTDQRYVVGYLCAQIYEYLEAR
jgi:hypothetical protein